MTKKNIVGFILLEGESDKIKKSISYLKDYEIGFITANNDENEVVVKVDMEPARFETFWDNNVHSGLLKKSVVKGL